MGNFGTTELVVIFLIVLVLFGSRRLPEIGKGLGKGIQNFRKSLKGEDEIDVTPKSNGDSAHSEISEDKTSASAHATEKEKEHV